MTRLISGRIEKTDSANVSADRYQYLRLEETEPDLGLPSSLGQVFTSDLSGGRSWVTLDTGNVNETSNLYYTNDRVQAFLQTSIFKDDVTLFSNLEVFGDLIVQGNTVQLNTATLIVEDKNIVLANGAPNPEFADGSGITIAGANANIIYNFSSDRFVFNKDIEANIIGVVSSISNFTTSNLLEGDNLYYTNSRVLSGLENANVYLGNLIAQGSIEANSLIIRGINVSDDALLGNVQAGTIVGNTLNITEIFVDELISDRITSNVWNNLYTSNVVEKDNLYYTNVRVQSYIDDFISTSNIIEGSNLYYTNARVLAHLSESNANVQSLTIDSDLIVRGTTNVVDIYSSNIYTQTITMGVGGLINGQGSNIGNFLAITAGNFYGELIGNVTGTVSSLSNHTTSNLTEGNNLYYTNARVLSALVDSNVYVGNLFAHDLIEANTLVIRGINVADDALLGNVQAGTIAGNTLNISNIFATDIITDSITSNVWNNLYTSNVVEKDNLYYTNARVVSAVTPLLTTANVVELDNLYYTNARVDAYINNSITTDDISEGTRLYYTNARVLAHLAESDVTVQDLTIAGNLVVQGNTTTLNTETLIVEDKNIVLANGAINAAAADGAGITIDGANATITFVAATDSFEINKNTVIQGNIISRSGTGGSITGANLIVANVIVALERIDGTATSALTANIANSVLTLSNFDTDDLTEGTRLYYTNARVDSRVSELSINVLADVDTTGILDGQTIVWDANSNTFIVTTLSEALAADFASLANVANTVTTLDNFTTSNLSEGVNLYYTNARVDSYINDSITTTDIDEGDNLYYTNARVASYLRENFTTDDITEGTNLYYTNARVVSAVTPLLTTSNVIELDNLYYTNARVLSHLAVSDVETRNLIVQGNLSVVGNLTTIFATTLEIEDPLVHIGANNETSDAVDLGWIAHYSRDSGNTHQHAGVIRDHQTGQFYIFSEYINPELDNGNVITDIDTTDPTFKLADVRGNIFYGRISTLDNHDTDDLTEGINLYYTNARVDSRVSELSINVLADVDITGIQDGQTIVWVNSENTFKVATLGQAAAANVAQFAVLANVANVVTTLANFTTSNLAEGVNLYYTNARVDAYINDSITTTDIDEGDNLYYTNSRVLAHLASSDVDVLDLYVAGNLTVQGDTTTLNTATLIVEDKNIVLANGAPNPTAASGAGITVDGASATILYTSSTDTWDFNKAISTSIVYGQVSDISNHDTDFLNEGITNFYYTNARVEGFISEFITTSNITEGDNLYYTNARVASYLRETFTTDDITEGDNLYYTNARVLAHLEKSDVTIANLIVTGEIEGVGNVVALAANVANISTQVENLSNQTTDDLAEGENNFYFSNNLARGAFTAGRGIKITVEGEISSIDDSQLYNMYLEDSVPYIVSNTMSSALTLDVSPANDRYILHSIHVTNITDNDVRISGNIMYADGNAAAFGNKIIVPVGASLEFQKRTQILNPGDIVNLQGFDATGNPINDALSAIITYEPIDNDPAFVGTGKEITESGDVQFFDSEESSTIIESIKLVNLENTIQRCKVLWTDANTNVKGYFAHNVSLPPFSTIEVLGTHKRIASGDLLFANCTTAGNVSVFLSGKRSSIFRVVSATTLVEPSDTIELSVQMPDNTLEGRTLYYTIE